MCVFPAFLDAWQLLLASFLTLFAELALIRWIAVELWIFAYFKNLALLLCFLGFGLGCALAGQTVRWSSALKAFLFVLLLVRVPWNEGTLLKMVSPMNAGLALSRLHNFDAAILEFREALRIKPDYAGGRSGLGLVYERMGNDKAAIEEYKKAIALDPDYSLAHYNLGNTYMIR